RLLIGLKNGSHATAAQCVDHVVAVQFGQRLSHVNGFFSRAGVARWPDTSILAEANELQGLCPHIVSVGEVAELAEGLVNRDSPPAASQAHKALDDLSNDL